MSPKSVPIKGQAAKSPRAGRKHNKNAVRFLPCVSTDDDFFKDSMTNQTRRAMPSNAHHGDLLRNTPRISEPFWDEILKSNYNELPKLKRIMLLSRGDLIGKAFANGVESLTKEERNMLLNQPPHELMEQNLKNLGQDIFAFVQMLTPYSIRPEHH